MYKKVSRLKLKFQTNRGVLSVEQLWDLSLTDLASAIKEVLKILKSSNIDNELSFLDDSIVVDVTNELRFEVLKDVYTTKKSEMDDSKIALETKMHNQKILMLISEKKEDGLKSKSIEELEKLLK